MKKVFLLTVAVLCVTIHLSAAESTLTETIDTAQASTAKVLKKMQASMNGKTLKGNTYSMYAIKAKKDWVFLIMDTLGIYSMKFDETADQLVESEQSYTEVLCLAAKSNSLKKKEKARTIAGTDLACYYKMQGKAAKMYKSVKKMNTKAKSITSRTRKEYRNAKKGVSKAKSMKGKAKKAQKTKGKSLL